MWTAELTVEPTPSGVCTERLDVRTRLVEGLLEGCDSPGPRSLIGRGAESLGALGAVADPHGTNGSCRAL